jgi:hypothetical protein
VYECKLTIAFARYQFQLEKSKEQIRGIAEQQELQLGITRYGFNGNSPSRSTLEAKRESLSRNQVTMNITAVLIMFFFYRASCSKIRL